MESNAKDSALAVLAFFACLAVTGGGMLIIWAVSDLLKMVIQGE